jgi:hypothetical protein
MKKKLLLSKGEKNDEVKVIAILDNPASLKSVLNEVGWKILMAIGEREMYPMEISKMLNMHEQKIYYHIRKLAKDGMIKVVREEEKKGAIAKYYKASFPAFGVELPFGSQKIEASPTLSLDQKTREFFNPFLRDDGAFDGKIVVGSPDPHGPFKARARDGHYVGHLSLFLGQFMKLPDEFPIKLDVDVKAEKDERNNLILVGGPGTNLITEEVNNFLSTRFNMVPTEQGFLFSGLVSEKTGNVYTGDTMGLIARLNNPWNEKKRIIVLAGNKAVGTKACVIALTRFCNETLKSFGGEEEFTTVIQGFDMDGDGKVDSIEVLE